MKKTALLLAAALALPQSATAALTMAGDQAFFFFAASATDVTHTDGKLWSAVTVSSAQRDAAKLGTPQVLRADLRDTTGAATGIGITMVNPTNGSSSQGGAGSTAWPAFAADLYLYGNTGSFGGSTDDGVATFTLTGFNPALSYNLDLFGARSGTGTRETDYSLAGAASYGTITIDVLGNTADSALFQNVSPNASGNFTLTLDSGATNSTTELFFYINAGKITVVPEPAAAILGLLGTGLFLRRRR